MAAVLQASSCTLPPGTSCCQEQNRTWVQTLLISAGAPQKQGLQTCTEAMTSCSCH